MRALLKELEDRRSRPRRVTWADLPFADGVYRFQLDRPQIAELERSASYRDSSGNERPFGVGAIFARLARGRPLLASGAPDWTRASEAEVLAAEIIERDVVQTIRLGLIGGKRGEVGGESVAVSPARADELIGTYVAGQPLEDGWTLAFAILGLLMFGRELQAGDA